MNLIFYILAIALLIGAVIACFVLIARLMKQTFIEIDENETEPEYVEDDLKEYFYLYADMFNSQAYKAGWTRVLAPDRDAADTVFRMYHPDYIDGLLSCSAVYNGETFRQTTIFKTGNYGEYEHETITASRMTIAKKGE